MKSSKLFSLKNLLLLLLAFISGILLSAKWMLAIAAWVHFTVLLRFYRDNNWKGFLLSIPVLTVAGIIAQTGVIPLDSVSIMFFILIGTTIGLLPYVIDILTIKHLPEWAKTLLFPTFFTAFNYVIDMGPQGTWGNNAYSQYSILPLMQIASITGIYGLNFLIYWFASTTNYLFEKRLQKSNIHAIVWVMPITLVVVLIYGNIQLRSTPRENQKTTLSTITMDNLDVLKSMYISEFNKNIELPKYVSQSDPLLQELQKGMLAFMSSPDASRFKPVYKEMDGILHKYMEATRLAKSQGAKIITWSEGAILNIKSREQIYSNQISQLADDLDVYLFFPTAVFYPEKVGKEDKFIENKVLTFNPEGELMNTYFKNIPIFGVEPSFPGDGNIPVIPTPYGNLSPIICYDADHPKLIAQVSHQLTDMLVVPTGDWKDISPYHTYMAAVRCIENGVSMLKSTSNGLSAMIDNKGRILASYDYFDDSEVKMIVGEFSIVSSKTLYSKSFPIFINTCFVFTILLLIIAVTRVGIVKLNTKNSKLEPVIMSN